MTAHFTASAAAALALLATTACKSDPADEPSPYITFYAESERGIVTTENISEFSVSAYTGGIPIMDHVTVVRTGSNSWHYSPAVMWPETPVDFYAVSPADTPLEINLSWENVIRVTQLDGKHDILISTCLDAIQTSSRLRLNFRHILSYVSVRIRSDNPDSRIIVKKISLKGFPTSGYYYLPKATTRPDNDITGTWTSWGADANYTLFEASPDHLVLNTGYTDIDGSGINFFIPSELGPIEGNWGGARIEVAYRVIDPATGATIWPDATTPYDQLFTGDRSYAAALYWLGEGVADHRWLPGRQYRYSLTLKH